MMNLSVAQRSESLKSLAHERFDLLIIGGGITGAGAARDAASRGLKVALVEANDFAFGTSSRSSKLIHGGIRYLENLEFNLVFEALSERSKLFELAPHLVHPLRFTLPVYENFRVGLWKLGAGMWLYDALALFPAPEGHKYMGKSETLEELPLLRKPGLKGSFTYSDAYMDDARLVVETLRSALRWGAHCVNFVRAGVPELKDGKIEAVHCEDRLTGQKLKIKADHVISSVGPWTDQVGAEFLPNWKNILRPTKGVHLTFARDRIKINQAVVMAEGRRIVFAIPRHEMVIIGTTDTDYRDSLDEVHAEASDVKYLFSVIDQYFPEAKLTPKDVLASFAGVRPLVHDGSGDEGKTSREHSIISYPQGLTVVAGGKYTTYRLMATETVNEALRFLSFDRRAALHPPQTEEPISPWASIENMQKARQQVNSWAQRFARPESEVQWLVDRFGMEAEALLARGLATDNLWQLEAKQAIQHGMCVNLVDFYFRRVPLFLAKADHGLSELPRVGESFQELLGWSDGELHRQQSELKEEIEREMNWRIEV